jgi:trk system potassium uptake protein TrkA
MADVVKILGRPSQIMKFLTNIKKRPNEQDVMIIGGGKITQYLVELLNRHTIRTNIKVIEKDREKCQMLSDALTLAELERRCLFIHGDGTNEELLIAEEIDKTDAFICLTDRDEENAVISIYALRMGVKKVVAKINQIHRSMIENLGLEPGNIITPQNITANLVVRYVDGLSGIIGSNIRTMHRIYSGVGGNVDAIEFQVNKNAKCLGAPLKNLKLKKGILIGCISRDSEIIIPSGETQIQIGDSVIIISQNDDIRELDDVLTNKTGQEE